MGAFRMLSLSFSLSRVHSLLFLTSLPGHSSKEDIVILPCEKRNKSKPTLAVLTLLSKKQNHNQKNRKRRHRSSRLRPPPRRAPSASPSSTGAPSPPGPGTLETTSAASAAPPSTAARPTPSSPGTTRLWSGASAATHSTCSASRGGSVPRRRSSGARSVGGRGSTRVPVVGLRRKVEKESEKVEKESEKVEVERRRQGRRLWGRGDPRRRSSAVAPPRRGPRGERGRRPGRSLRPCLPCLRREMFLFCPL